MTKITKRSVSLLLCAVLLCALLAACGDQGGEGQAQSGDIETYTWLLAKGEEAFFYEEYEDNPAVQYWLRQEWDADGDGAGKKIAVDFITLPTGAEADNVNTMMATGEYPMIMDTTYSSEKAAALYEKGIVLDVTEYVENYMPNYMQWIQDHPEYGERLVNTINGEKKYLGVYGLHDSPARPWGGYCYRRDWIVKYGKNPTTGAAFSGEWQGDNWVDDVVFPSGNTDPIYISDWEWMLDIFATALEDLNITDGYVLSLYYPGYLGTGDFICAFGGGGGSTHINPDGIAVNDVASDDFRAYLECMRTWWDKGWIDPQFDERSSDMFFMVNTPATFGGKVGAWYGQMGTLGSAMDTSGGDTSNPVNGIVVAGAPQPINDVYGPDSCKNQIPYTYYGNGMIDSLTVFTDKCKDMDLPTLFTAIDSLFEPDGGALLRSYGLTAEQVEEFDCQWYRDRGLSDGAYSIGTDAEGQLAYTVNPVLINDQEGLESACKINRVVGLTQEKERVYLDPPCKQHWLQMWTLYPITGYIGNELSGQLTADQQKEVDSMNNYVNTYMSRTIPKFVKGELDIWNDKDWNDHCAMLAKYNPNIYAQYLNEILGN